MQQTLGLTFYAQSTTGTELTANDCAALVAAKPVRAGTCLIQSCGIDTSET